MKLLNLPTKSPNIKDSFSEIFEKSSPLKIILQAEIFRITFHEEFEEFEENCGKFISKEVKFLN
jgi:hypothetical protein